MTVTTSGRALACVMGGMDLVRPLGLAGISCAVVTQPGKPSVYSRFTRTALCWRDLPDEQLVDALVRFGAGQAVPPVLFYMADLELLLVSRYRNRLRKTLRFAIADPALVEDLVDKVQFQALAERLQLPVPAARRLQPVAGSDFPHLDLRFPIIIKPLTRLEFWHTISRTKAIQVDHTDALRKLWPRLIAGGKDLLAQELVSGPETCVESYHVYVDQQDSVVAEFTGRKIRTYPVSYGYSTALEITDAADVKALGRILVERLNLRGVAKFDFKRGPDGTLHLLEVNPRFNMWHHLGAMAGVNIPALVYSDMNGLPRPTVACARAGTRWCRIWEDARAARAHGLPLFTWLPWALGCDAKSVVAWDDPMPLLGGTWFRATRAVRELVSRCMNLKHRAES
jgi:D-aspartate ligase